MDGLYWVITFIVLLQCMISLLILGNLHVCFIILEPWDAPCWIEGEVGAEVIRINGASRTETGSQRGGRSCVTQSLLLGLE